MRLGGHFEFLDTFFYNISFKFDWTLLVDSKYSFSTFILLLLSLEIEIYLYKLIFGLPHKLC